MVCTQCERSGNAYQRPGTADRNKEGNHRRQASRSDDSIIEYCRRKNGDYRRRYHSVSKQPAFIEQSE